MTHGRWRPSTASRASRGRTVPAEALTRERMIVAAEDVLRRYGPAKANVVDVARALGVSHGSVYRHFPSKAAHRDAVTERCLAEVSSPLEGVAGEKGPADERLQRWLDLLVSAKRRRALDDPELFATYSRLHARSSTPPLASTILRTPRNGRPPASTTPTKRSVSSSSAGSRRARIAHAPMPPTLIHKDAR